MRCVDLGCDADMLACSNPDCPLGLWFHIDCLQLEEGTDTSGDWCCSPGCQEAFDRVVEPVMTLTPDNETDYVRNYAISVVWNGLLDRAHRDAVREADGLMMMTMWRINILRFWSGHHFKYLKIGHRLLAGSIFTIVCQPSPTSSLTDKLLLILPAVDYDMNCALLLGINGWYPATVIDAVVHNRTVNVVGGLGRNVEMDLVCEWLNKDFKGTRYTTISSKNTVVKIQQRI